MSIKGFSEYIAEAKGEITFVFGRFNPPTSGHEKLFNKLKEVSSGSYRIYASKSQDAKKNPLSFKDKIKFVRKMFPKHARSVMADNDVRHVMDIATKLYDQGYTAVQMVAGSDRVNEFEILLNKYNGVKSRHGFYEFKDGIKVISAGERDPDAEGVSGMSASKMRQAAGEGSIQTFAKGVPSGADPKELYKAVRKGMGLTSEAKREHIELPKVSDTREDYVEGKLFKVGDEVVLKETSDVGNILVCGTNYLVVEFGAWKKRVWLDQVELVENCGGVGEKKVTDKYKTVTPSETPQRNVLKSFSDMTKDMNEKGLWDNIRKKKKSGKKMNPKGHPDAPTDAEIKSAQGKK